MRLRLTGLQPGQTYAIQVRANNGEAVSEWGRKYQFVAQTDLTIPSVPTNFAFTNDETTSFYATWDDVTTNTDGSDITDFSHYELLLDNGVIQQTIISQDPKYTLTFENNANVFGVASPNITASVRCIDIYGNASDYTNTINTVNQIPAPVPDNDGTHVFNAIGIPDAIRVIWQAPDVVEEDFSAYSVHMDTTTGAFTPTEANKVWEGHATSYVHATTDYSTTFHFKTVRHDVFGQQSTNNPADFAQPIHGSKSGDPPTGPAGGDLTGSYPDPQIASGVITDANVAAGNIDGSASVPSLRTLGTGANQAAAGNDPRFGSGGGTTVVGDIDIDCGGPSSDGVDIDCGVMV